MSRCPSCQSPLPASGICGRCILTRLDEMEREPVRRLGDYDLLEEIGQGGMGLVWRARHRELGRTVALKTIRGGGAAGESEVLRFRTEAEAVARLEHPGIVPVYELGESDGLPFFTMPLMEGGSLSARLTESRPLPNREAAEILSRVARAVAHAHSRGVLHRDLKPANILFDAAGVPHVADFGLARLMGTDAGLTRTGAMLGTPAYAAPEQVRGDPPTTAGDIYSLGAILYHLICGRPVWTGRDALDILRAASTSEPATPKSLNPSVARDLQIIAMHCLARVPTHRYATADAMADDLDRWLRGEPIHARPASRAERLWKWVRRRPAAAALVMTGAVSLASIFILRVVSERQLRQESDAARRAEAGTRAAAASLRENLYVSDMALAIHAIQDGNHTLARRILRRQNPEGGGADLRGFEWQWLQRTTAGGEALVLRGFTKPVYAVAFSPDSRLIAGGGEDGIIRLWRLTDGSPAGEIPRADRRDIDNMQHVVDQIALAPKLIKFRERFPEILREPATINLISAAASPGYVTRINSLSFSADGLLIAAGTAKNTKVWQTGTGEMLHVIPYEHSMAAFQPGSSRLFVTSGYTRFYDDGEGRISVWNLPDLERDPRDFGRSTLPPAFIAGGAILTGGHRGERVWQRRAADGTLIVESDLNQGHRVLASATSEDGSLGVVADDRGPEVQVAVSDGTRPPPLICGRAMVASLAISPDGQTIAAACNDHSVRLWGRDWRERPPLRGHEAAVQQVAFSPDGRWLASAGDDHTVRLWSTLTPPPPEQFRSLTEKLITHAGGLALGHVNESVELWAGEKHFRLEGGAPERGRERRGWPLGFAPDGSRAAVLRFTAEAGNIAAGDAALEWFRTSDGSRLSSLPLPNHRHFRGAALSPDGRRLVRLGQKLPLLGSPLCLVDTETGRTVATARADVVTQEFSTFSPDGRMVIIGCEGLRIIAYDAASLAILWQLEGPVNRCGIFTPDSRTFITALGDQIHLCDAATGRERMILSGHTATVRHLAVHPDGRTLASAGPDRTVRLWHLTTGRELGIVHASPEFAITCLAFTADGSRLIAGRHGGPALIL